MDLYNNNESTEPIGNYSNINTLIMEKGIVSENNSFKHISAESNDKFESTQFKPAKQIEYGKDCCLFSYETANEAMKSTVLEVIDDLGGGCGEGYNYNEGSRKLCKCKNCGALFLNYRIKFLSMVYDSDSVTHSNYLPVHSRDEALEYCEKYIGSSGLSDSYIGKKIWLGGLTWCWNHK